MEVTRPIRLTMLAGCLLLAACSPATLYKQSPGPFGIQVDEVTIRDTVYERDVNYRVLHPDGAGPFPVMVFSHGGFCPPDNYDRLTKHWVSHGYIVIAPNHVDSPNNEKKPGREEMAIIVQSRLGDASRALDALDEIAAQAGFAGSVREKGRGIAGHSFGAGVAMMKTGQNLKPGERDSWGNVWDKRFEAAVYLSAPGGGPEMSEDAFDGLSVPFIATGGTNDLGRVDPGDLSPGDWRRQVFLRAPPGDKYSVILEGSDHYLGGLICNLERGDDPDPNALEIFRAMTVAFLDAYLNEDDAAMNFLRTANVADLTQGRADYRYR